jgi:hypothetical protein
LFVLNIKSALQRDLDRFFGKLNNLDFSIHQATKGAFSNARKKLNPRAFQRLNDITVDTFYREAEYYVWGGHRVLATRWFLLCVAQSSQRKGGIWRTWFWIQRR